MIWVPWVGLCPILLQPPKSQPTLLEFWPREVPPMVCLRTSACIPPRAPSLVQGAEGTGGCPGPTFPSLPAIVPSSCILISALSPAAKSGDSLPFFLMTYSAPTGTGPPHVAGARRVAWLSQAGRGRQSPQRVPQDPEPAGRGGNSPVSDLTWSGLGKLRPGVFRTLHTLPRVGRNSATDSSVPHRRQ